MHAIECNLYNYCRVIYLLIIFYYFSSDINSCSSNPCMNEGHCIDLKLGFRCECKAGFWGRRCEKEVDECSLKPCLNGGKCLDKVWIELIILHDWACNIKETIAQWSLKINQSAPWLILSFSRSSTVYSICVLLLIPSLKATCASVQLALEALIAKHCMEFANLVFVVQMENVLTWLIIRTRVFAMMATLVPSVRHL